MLKIALIFNNTNPGTTGNYIAKILTKAGIVFDHFPTEQACKIPRNYDLYFRVDHGDYKFDIPGDMHPSVFYAIDTHLRKPYRKIRRQAGHYDIVFCAQAEGAERLRREIKGLDAQWVPLGCDPEAHKKVPMPKTFDIGFVGRNAEKFARGRYLDLLREKFPKSHIDVYPYERMYEIYCASKIAFNISVADDVNMRMFETLSCGAFLLTNKVRDPGFTRIFQDGVHLATYSNEKDLLKKIEYYLARPDERERIAQAGHALVVSKYSYFHAVQRMLNYVAFKFGGDYNDLRI